MDDNKKVLSEGWHIGSQSPMDDRLIFSTTSELQNLGLNNQEAYRYYEGMEVLVVSTKKYYRWQEATSGLLASNFTYPANIIINNVNYSNRFLLQLVYQQVLLKTQTEFYKIYLLVPHLNI